MLFQPTSGPQSVAPPHTNTKYAVSPVTGLLPGQNPATPGGGSFGPGDYFNYAPYNYFQRPDTRYQAGEFSTYNINSHVNIYSSFMFLDDHTVAAIAPSGSFNGTNVYTVPCNDPLLSPAEQTALCGAALAGTPTTETANIAHRNVEGGPRVSDLEHFDYRMVLGSKGDLADGWTYDASAQYGRSQLTDIESGYLLNSKLKNALDVVPGPSGPVCAVGGSCVPYNIFGYVPGGVTAAQLAYLSGVAESSGATTEQVYTVSITGDLGKYGLKSAWANKAVGVNLGVEYRDENLIQQFDAAIQSGDLAGSGAPPRIPAGLRPTRTRSANSAFR